MLDTINHKILCHKLGTQFGTQLCHGSKVILRIGLNLSSLGPVNLTVAKFHVSCNRDQSLSLFCSFYTNDLPNVSSLTQSLLFADDTNIFCSIRIPTPCNLPRPDHFPLSSQFTQLCQRHQPHAQHCTMLSLSYYWPRSLCIHNGHQVTIYSNTQQRWPFGPATFLKQAASTGTTFTYFSTPCRAGPYT